MSNAIMWILDGVLTLIGLVGTLWIFFRAFKNAENRAMLVLRWITTLVVVLGSFHLALAMCNSGNAVGGMAAPFVMVAMGIAMSIMWTPSIAEIVSRPLTGLFDGSNEPQEAKPLYSMAMAKRQRGRLLEATMAVREQLARFPNDFEGISLLAKIQAEDMKDLQSAEMTLNKFCADPKTPPRQFVAAMTQLADWHLQLAQDTYSARLALEKIVAHFPSTDMALAAEQRIAHLDGAEKILIARHDNQTFGVPEGVENVGLLESSEFLQRQEEDPGKVAGVYVKHLQRYPNDTEVREKLAVIYADHYKRLDMAVAELAQMINTPNQPPKKVAHWLTLMANLQIRHGADYDTVRQTLEKIVNAFPDLPVSQSARSRIEHLKLEFKGTKEETPAKKLGVYEQNIGLKYGRPGRPS